MDQIVNLAMFTMDRTVTQSQESTTATHQSIHTGDRQWPTQGRRGRCSYTSRRERAIAASSLCDWFFYVIVLHVSPPKTLSPDAFSRAQMRLAAGFRPDPLGSLSAPPDPIAAIRGGVLLLNGREGRRDVDGRGRGEKGG